MGASVRVCAVLDGQAVLGLPERLARAKADGLIDAWDALARGALRHDQAQAAAYIVQLQPASEFTTWLLGEARNAHIDWGVLLVGETSFLNLREHARALTQVNLPDGSRRTWRWYDPALLRLMMPLYSAQQAQSMLQVGQVLVRLVVPSAQAWLTYRWEQGALASGTEFEVS